MVNRYHICGVSGLTLRMKQTSDGDYVKYEDYKEFQAENERLKTENKSLQQQLLLSESQHYCKIRGNTLDGYVPSNEVEDGKKGIGNG